MPDEDDTSVPPEAGQPEEDSTGTEGGEPEGREAAPEEQAALPENRRARRAAAATARRKGGPGERPAPRPQASGLDAGEMVDEHAFARAADGSAKWVKRNFNIVQWLIVGGIAGWIGFQIYSWRADTQAVKVGGLINEAVAAELGRIGAPDEEGKRDERGSLDTRRIFPTNEERLKAAREAYQAVASSPGKSGATLAKLGEAGVAFDQGKFDEAQKLYEAVYGSELTKTDPEAKGRSLEGIALCLEAKNDPEGALKRYSELENTEIQGFRELALYNQARLLHAKGDDTAAKERLKKVLEKLGKESAGPGNENYLTESARALLTRIDPKEVPAANSDEALRKALEQFQKSLPPGVKQIPMPVPQSP